MSENKNLERIKNLLSKASTLPSDAGCYLMIGPLKKILYVGKAKNLKSRVTSYFNQSQKNAKTHMLVSHIQDFEFIITGNDAEAFVLENNLIKKHTPKYNIRLKDDKTYPYVEVNFNENYPKLDYVRRPKREKNREIFGPFVVGSNISEILRLLTKLFMLRDCSIHDFKTRKEPCLLYQMKQCTAPCMNLISKEDYSKNLESALNFFKGKKKALSSLKFLENKMLSEAENENFELAASLRDQIKILKEFTEASHQKNSELHEDSLNVDIVAFYQGEIEVDLSIYLIRNGILLGHKTFHFATFDLIEEIEDEVASYLLQYYTQTFELPPQKIITDLPASQNLKLAEALKIVVENPKRKFKNLYDLTLEHAKESGRIRSTNEESYFIGLNKLKELLNLKERPQSLECFDVAIWQGKSPAASQIHFYEGKPDKKKYRYYHLKELPEGNNDFKMMQELFSRRLDNGDLPDVFIVDGGIGQINAVQKILTEFKIEIPVIGLAKSKTESDFKSSKIKKSEERLIIPGRTNPFILSKNVSLFKILVSMRDEAHRFSRKLHHHAEKKRLFKNKKSNLKRG